VGEAKSCSDFSWFGSQQETYLIRLSEILLVVASLVNLCKFLYLCGLDWYMRRRFPFQDEVQI
jgi:hypothetical protein